MNIRYMLMACGVAMSVSVAAQGNGFLQIAGDIARNSAAYKADMARMTSEVEELKAGNVLENPEVEFEHLWSAGPSENKWNAGISQSFDWPGAYRARSRAAEALSVAQTQALNQTFQSLEQRAAELMAGYIAAKRKLDILSGIHESMQQLRAHYEKAWESGETTILDLNKMKIEVVRSGTELEQAHAEFDAVKAELTAMAPDAEATQEALQLTDFPYMPLEELDAYMQLAQTSPEVMYQSALIDAQNANASAARTQRLPGFNLGYVHAFEEGTHFNGFSVGLSLPVYSRKHSVAAATLLAEAARFDRSSALRQLETKIIADHSAAVAFRKQMELYAPVVEGVNNLALLRKALDGGELSLLDYLQETGYFMRARLDYLDISRDYTLLLIRLATLGGA